MTILITGGLGFIGSNTTISLLNYGYQVLIIDSLINSNVKTLDLIKSIYKKTKVKKSNLYFREGDLRDHIWLKKIFEEFYQKNKPIKSVIHLAGLKSVRGSVLNPNKYWDHNLNSTLNLLKIISEFPCENFIFSSSATIYKPNKAKLSEHSQLEPINPYGNTKYCIEMILNDFYSSQSNNFNLIKLRYFNPAGSHSSGLLREDPRINTENIFPTIYKVIKRDIEYFPIYGGDWPTKDGTCVRDYIHITDLAEAHTSALKYSNSKKNLNLILNIGTGEGKSVVELIKTFSRVNNVKIPYKIMQRRLGDSPYLVANNSLALKLLDWNPKRTLKDICVDFWKSLKK